MPAFFVFFYFEIYASEGKAGSLLILGIGTDILETRRIREAIENPHFVSRVYTPAEQAYCDSRGAQRAQGYAARFAGKEAVLKAFGTGLRDGKLAEIEILPDALGCPRVKLYGYFAQSAAQKGVRMVHISLSHTKEYVTAQCVMEGKEL